MDRPKSCGPRMASRVRVLVVGVLALIGLALAVVWAQAPPSGPQPVAWSHTACARCRMLVGEPGYAAQLHTADGQVHHFDDPGCLLLFEQELAEAPREVWLHHREHDRWLAREQVAFADADATPMGYGLAAVDANEPGALGWPAALERARLRDAQRSAP